MGNVWLRRLVLVLLNVLLTVLDIPVVEAGLVVLLNLFTKRYFVFSQTRRKFLVIELFPQSLPRRLHRIDD